MKQRRDYLAWAALLFALVATASAEYELARAVGFNQWVAAAVPGALDIYTVRAMRARRDVPVVVAAMIGVNAASHLVTAGLLPVNVPLVVAVSAIAPLVLWRVHRLTDHVAAQVDTPAVDPVSTPAHVDTPAVDPVSTGVPSLPAADSAPVPSPHVGSVDTQVDTPVSTSAPEPAEVDTAPAARLSTEAARAVIEEGWRNGDSVRSTATAATRHPSLVSRVYRELDDARDSQAGRLTLIKEASA
ncbi:hypothetical protein [Streptomyces sp. NPDC001221]